MLALASKSLSVIKSATFSLYSEPTASEILIDLLPLLTAVVFSRLDASLGAASSTNTRISKDTYEPSPQPEPQSS